MTTQTRHALRLVMRTAYTATAFFVGMLYAAISHDGLSPAGGVRREHVHLLGAAVVLWALAVVLDGVTSQAGRGKR